jgi:hypothetical protein
MFRKLYVSLSLKGVLKRKITGLKTYMLCKMRDIRANTEAPSLKTHMNGICPFDSC